MNPAARLLLHVKPKHGDQDQYIAMALLPEGHKRTMPKGGFNWFLTHPSRKMYFDLTAANAMYRLRHARS